MINFANRFDEYAYRVASRELDPSVTTLEEGQWVTVNASGKLVVADGTTKSFLAIGSKRVGRDQISGVSVKKISYLVGPFELTVTNFDATGTYANMTPLVVIADGILSPATPVTVTATTEDNVTTYAIAGSMPDKIVAYSMGAPVNGELRIVSA